MLGLKLFFGDKHSERVFIRVDASSTIGIGHLMRCLTLANHLAETSFEVTFILSSHSAQSVHLIEKNGFEFFIIECDVVDLIMSGNELLPWNWQDDATRTSRIIRQAVRDQNVLLIVDHYQLDAKWEHALRPLVSKLVIIDDLANREHDCDILIDSNSVLATRYTGLVPAHCHQLLGQTYAMIRADVTHLRKDEFEIREEIKTIIVFMGGGDFNNSTLVVVDMLKSLVSTGVYIQIVVGRLNPHLSLLRQAVGGLKQFEIVIEPDNYHLLLALSDVAIGAGGVAVSERCCIGVPSLIITIADNQIIGVKELSTLGAVLQAGDIRDAGFATTFEQCFRLIQNKQKRHELSVFARNVFDGLGARRVVARIERDTRSVHLRQAIFADVELLFEWRNHPLVRQVPGQSQPLGFDDHRTWLSTTLSCQKSMVLIVMLGDRPVGTVRHHIEGDVSEVSVIVDPLYRGLGLATYALVASETSILDRWAGLKEIKATVANNNLASRHVFGQIHYNVRNDRDGWVYMYKCLRGTTQ